MRASALFVAAVLAGCPSAPEPEPEAPPEPDISVVDALSFAREEPEGFSLGFDLDGLDTDGGDPTGCGIDDFRHAATGAPGIDNGFAKLLPVLELAGGGPLEQLIQAAVNSGELLLIVELVGLDSWEEDDCVDVAVTRAAGPPRVGGTTGSSPGRPSTGICWRRRPPSPALRCRTACCWARPSPCACRCTSSTRRST